MGKIDLHMHTKYSDDGEFTPKELIDKCIDSGLKMMAFADHNSVKGIEEGKKYAEKNGIKFINATEIDCKIGNINLHVLGYNLNKNLDAIDEYEQSIISQEIELSKKRIDAIKSVGIEIDENEVYKLSSNGAVTGEMIAEVALANKNNHGILKEYLDGGSRSDNPYVNFYWDYFGNGEFSNLKPVYMDLEKTVDMIVEAGGIPVLAHPGQNISEDEEVLKKIIDTGVKGIEVFSSYHTKEQVDFYHSFAKDNNLLETIGSDFHGKTKPSIHLGQSMADDDVENTLLNFFGDV
ncbi:MAG: PHP domain-containing protein [Pseudobutyrivibrio sp.]|nr:PHP domain-containing protein [Pseudobutyrivibrio sp.]